MYFRNYDKLYPPPVTKPRFDTASRSSTVASKFVCHVVQYLSHHILAAFPRSRIDKLSRLPRPKTADVQDQQVELEQQQHQQQQQQRYENVQQEEHHLAPGLGHLEIANRTNGLPSPSLAENESSALLNEYFLQGAAAVWSRLLEASSSDGACLNSPCGNVRSMRCWYVCYRREGCLRPRYSFLQGSLLGCFRPRHSFGKAASSSLSSRVCSLKYVRPLPSRWQEHGPSSTSRSGSQPMRFALCVVCTTSGHPVNRVDAYRGLYHERLCQ